MNLGPFSRLPPAARWLMVVLSLLMSVSGFAAQQTPKRVRPDFDNRRPETVRVVPADKGFAAAQLRSRLRGAQVEADPLTDAPRFVGSVDAFLSGPGGKGGTLTAPRAPKVGEKVPEVAAFVDEYRSLFGYDSTALADAQVKRDYTNRRNGLRSVVWQQALDGVPVFDGIFQAHVTRRGELVNVASHFLPNPAQAANRGTPRRAAMLAAPTISAAQAIAIAGTNIGETIQVAGVTATDAAQGAEKKQAFRGAALRGAAHAQLTWLPMNKESARLCWDVVLTGRTSGEMYRVVVDASSGETHVRRCLTNYISEATYRVFTGDSPTPMQPGHATPSSAQPAQAARTLVTLSALDTTASPNGWINDGVNETRGNNVDAHLDLDGNNVADTPRPQGSPDRVFDFPLDLSQEPSAYRNAAVTQLFYWCNWMHDKLYGLGFTEAAGNFQVNNFGRGGLGGDAVEADAQDGSGTNNANFSTPPDGISGRMQMFVFSGPTPDRDGNLDATVVLHEYGHGVSNRLVGGGVGITALASLSMGEGWSDFYALAMLSKAADDVHGNYVVGGYSTLGYNGLTQNYYYGIRRYPYSTNLAVNPLTFKDIDPAQAAVHFGIPRSPAVGNTANEVHNAGEVWCAALWEVRANLIAKHGFEVGNQLALQLITDGLKLTPGNPNFLHGRDAIIQADQVNNAGANITELWTAFAKRGMGASATAPSSSTTTGVLEAFDMPDPLNVMPLSNFIGVGPVGGPFDPSSVTYTLKNTGSTPLNWTATTAAPWLNLSSTSGSLEVNATTTVTVSVTSAANALPVGIFTENVVFTNTATGGGKTRTASLYVGQPDYFTELFTAASPNDTANQTFTFTPSPSSNSQYYVTRQSATSFPSDTTTGSTNVPMLDDTFATVNITGGSSVKLFGNSYTTFYVGSNGFITFGSGDTEWVESLEAHFLKPRIAALFRDLNPATGGNVRRRQFADHIAVTWLNVPEYGTNNSNSVQIEMFFDGRIRITILGIASTKGLIGLSRGTGVPAGYSKSNFSGYPPPTTFTMTLPGSAAEGAGPLANAGVVRLSHPYATDVAVTLTSSDPAAVAVPASVTVPSGELSATFTPTILDDDLINGLHAVTITASASGWTSGGATISISDNENLNLAISPANLTEGGSASGSVAISGKLPTDLTVNLSSAVPSRLSLPASIIIPAGATSATFLETATNNAFADGAASVLLTSTAAGFTSAADKAMVFDDEELDTDHDGLPDTWENAGGLNLFDPVGQQGALGDLSGNGVPNLLKYAFGQTPQSTDVGVLPWTTIESDVGNSAEYLTLRYHRLLLPGLLQYEVQVSADLEEWTANGADFLELPPAVPDSGGLTETVTVRLLPALGTPGTPMRYIRVHVFVPQ